MPRYLAISIALMTCASPVLRAQSDSAAEITPADNNVAHPMQRTEAKRLFGIVPNYRTSDTLHPYVPISAKQKFHLAAEDSFDRGTVILAAAFAGGDQISDSDKSYGQGAEGYAKYFAASYATFVIGNYLTEGIFPAVLHQDPRYFRLGCCGWKRLGYAMGQIFWTHTDRGTGQVNFSELGGNAVAVAISDIYYPDDRAAGEFVSGWATQIGVDMGVNILKEFWPEINRKLSRRHETPANR
jgi:hypothetical protein